MITVRLDDRELRSKLTSIERRQLPFATAVAINATTADVIEDNKRLMSEVFDRPTRWTLNAFTATRATKAKPFATIERKAAVGRRFYLEVQSEGGARRLTGIEGLFKQRANYDGPINAVIATKHIRRNKHGNVAPGAMQRILSGVKVQRDRSQNSTSASGARSRGRRGFYFIPKQSSRLSKGVFERRGRRIRKVLSFTKAVPRYQKRFPMEENSRRVMIRVLPGHMKRAFIHAVRTAR